MTLRAPQGHPDSSRLGDIALDARALVFTLLVSLGADVLLGLPPALKYPRRRIAAAVHGSGAPSAAAGFVTARRTSSWWSRWRWRSYCSSARA